MNLIIIPDIFGRTPALDRLAERLCIQLSTVEGNTDTEPHAETCIKTALTIDIIDPYDGLYFFREDQAYKYFKANLGVPGYSRMILEQLPKQTTPVTILGFSAGASAVWHLSCETLPCPVNFFIGFYGSQIRHFKEIQPKIDTHLIFPDYEHYFDVNDLAAQLNVRPRVSIEKAAAGHGFMNEYSIEFDPDICEKYVCTRLPDLITSNYHPDF